MRKAREFAGLGQVELAEETGISRRTIVKYERAGDVEPPKSILLLVQMRTGVPAEWILTGEYTPRDLNPEPTDSEMEAGDAIVTPLRSVDHKHDLLVA